MQSLEDRYARWKDAPLSWSPERPSTCWLKFSDSLEVSLGADPDGTRFRRIADLMSGGLYYPPEVIRFFSQQDFIKRFGDKGDDEFEAGCGTIPQRLLMMNGKLVEESVKASPFNADTRIGWLAPDDERAVEIAYLTALTRRPTPDEARHFQRRLAGSRGDERSRRMVDLFWTLINATEFSWNH